MMGNNKQVYFNLVLDKFIDEFLLLPSTSFPGPTQEEEDQENEVGSLSASEDSQSCMENTDLVEKITPHVSLSTFLFSLISRML